MTFEDLNIGDWFTTGNSFEHLEIYMKCSRKDCVVLQSTKSHRIGLINEYHDFSNKVKFITKVTIHYLDYSFFAFNRNNLLIKVHKAGELSSSSNEWANFWNDDGQQGLIFEKNKIHASSFQIFNGVLDKITFDFPEKDGVKLLDQLKIAH